MLHWTAYGRGNLDIGRFQGGVGAEICADIFPRQYGAEIQAWRCRVEKSKGAEAKTNQRVLVRQTDSSEHASLDLVEFRQNTCRSMMMTRIANSMQDSTWPLRGFKACCKLKKRLGRRTLRRRHPAFLARSFTAAFMRKPVSNLSPSNVVSWCDAV